MKKKLKLDQIKVESFITAEKKNVTGGAQVQSYNIPCSDFARCTPDLTDLTRSLIVALC